MRYAALHRLVRTASFRLAATYLAIFALSVVVLGIVIYFSAGREILAELDTRVKEQTATLQAVYRANGLDRLADEVRARTLEAASLDYRLEDRLGRFLAGNLPSPRAKDGLYRDGWVQLTEPGTRPAAATDPAWERALVTTLDGGAVLVVGAELDGIREARRAVLVAFAWALAATVAIGSLGGLAISAAFLRRIDAMTRTAQGIIAGNMEQRIPLTNADDDLGRLAKTFNQMLDRIGSLLEANKQVSNDIAHDLRSPLARVLRRLEAARARGAGLDEYQSAVEASIQDIHSILETFNALLRVGQIETGARRSGFKPVDLAAIALEVAEAFQPTAVDESKSLVIALDAPLPLLGDKELLTQLVANLIDNAMRHTLTGAQILVSGAITAGGAQLTVADDGPGVPSEALNRIFQRFYRVDRARATPGDGLGLSLVAAIAELHGGRVAAVDNEPGLRVVVTLPGGG